MKNLYLILLTFFAFFYSQFLYIEKVESFKDEKTIKDLNNDIKNIARTEDEIERNYKNFLKDYKVETYFKKNLTKEDYKNIKNTANFYTNKILRLENNLSRIENEDELIKIHSQVIDLKKDLYKSMIYYIDNRNYDKYLLYIEESIKKLVEKNSLQITKIKTKDTYNRKIETLEKKIKENKNYLDEHIKNTIEQRFEHRVNQFIDSPLFNKLKKEDKIKALETLSSKIREKINYSLTKTNISNTDLLNIKLYKSFINKINVLIANIK